MNSKQTMLDSQKNELRAIAEKLKTEENSRKNCQKVFGNFAWCDGVQGIFLFFTVH